MIAFGMSASIRISSLDVLLLTDQGETCIGDNISEQEGLQLDQDGLNSVSRGPSLVDLLLGGIKDIQANIVASKHIWMSDRCEKADSGR